MTLLKHHLGLLADFRKPTATTQSFLSSSIELTTLLPNLNLHPVLEPQDRWVGTISRFVAAADRVVAQRLLHKPAAVLYASQVWATSNRRTRSSRLQLYVASINKPSNPRVQQLQRQQMMRMIMPMRLITTKIKGKARAKRASVARIRKRRGSSSIINNNNRAVRMTC